MPATTEHKSLATEPMAEEEAWMEDGMAADKLFNGTLGIQLVGCTLVFFQLQRPVTLMMTSFLCPVM